MRISINEVGFLIFFLPLFVIKLFNITAENKILMMTGGGCFACFIFFALKKKYSQQLLKLFILLLGYTTILIFTCGKQGAFFSVIMLIAMKGIDMDRRIYRICFLFGLFFLFLSCYSNRHGEEVLRFMYGEWMPITKRSNILYINFTAVVCLYLLSNKKDLSNRQLACIFILCYFMFLYTGARTGFISMILLLFLITVLRNKSIREKRIVRYGCILSPTICMGESVFSALKYGEIPALAILDNLLQGRIYQGHIFLKQYNIKLLGQHIYESYGNDYRILDCAYLDMLICEGFIFLALWILVTQMVIKYMYDNNRMMEVAMLVMYAVYGICETFLPNCFLNVSLFLYGEYLYATDKTSSVTSQIPTRIS